MRRVSKLLYPRSKRMIRMKEKLLKVFDMVIEAQKTGIKGVNLSLYADSYRIDVIHFDDNHKIIIQYSSYYASNLADTIIPEYGHYPMDQFIVELEKYLNSCQKKKDQDHTS